MALSQTGRQAIKGTAFFHGIFYVAMPFPRDSMVRIRPSRTAPRLPRGYSPALIHGHPSPQSNGPAGTGSEGFEGSELALVIVSLHEAGAVAVQVTNQV